MAPASGAPVAGPAGEPLAARRTVRRLRWSGLLLAALLLPAAAADIRQVPLWDGETSEPPDGSATLINRFGGPVVHLGQTGTELARVAGKIHSGTGAYRVGITAAPRRNFAFFQLALSGFGPGPAYVVSRDLRRFDSMCFWLSNDTGAALTLKLEIKDERDSPSHRLHRSYELPADGAWARYCAPLASGWSVAGDPDLQRARFIGFVFENLPDDFSGNVFIDDLVLVEPGPPLDSSTAPLFDMVGQLARRQFEGLWGSRSRSHGLIPLNSVFADIAALNTTSAVVWLLPDAVRRGWVTKAEADGYVVLVAETLHRMMDRLGPTAYLPARYVDWVSLEPALLEEQSPVDAAFMALALYRYRALPGSEAVLRARIDALLARFDFAAFGSPQGWKLAYALDPPGFTPGSYDGYSGEIWAISLAAQLMPVGPVAVATHYHSGVNRLRTFLASPGNAHVVHSDERFRAPFLQWLFPLFVLLDGRTADNYPTAGLATNPLGNACRYQKDAHASLAGKDRSAFLQKDAGDDGSGSQYEQFSEYWDGAPPRPDLFMPWSLAFSLLAEGRFAAGGLRQQLAQGLHGPLGLSDAVHWAAGAAGPTLISARHDFWNVSLSTMAMLSFLSPPTRPLTALPEVRRAIETVGMKACCSRDFDGNGHPDLVFQNDATGLIGVWLMDGTALEAAVPFTPFQVPAAWKIMGVGDFDGDGRPDLVWQNEETGHVGVWLMDGTTLRAAAPFAPSQVPAAWKIMGVGDFDGDGRPDLVWQNGQTGHIGVWFMDGTTLRAASAFAPAQVPVAWQIAAVADFDGDGNPDLVWKNTLTGQLGVTIMDGTRVAGATLFGAGSLPPDAELAAATALNGDCTADLIWRRAGDGSLGVSYMDADGALASGDIGAPAVPAGWQIRNR
jgi:hypothetical protein